jgi:hypothetical protein
MSYTHPKLCPGTRICCPSCGGVLPKFSVHTGHGFYLCTRKIGEGYERRTCSQHVLFYATNRLVAVIVITELQRQRFDNDHFTLPLATMLEELGVEVASEPESIAA